MAVLLQQLINGFFIGSVYGLFAVGYTLVFGVLDILNLAHAAIFTLGGLTALWLTTAAGLSIWIAFPLAALFSGIPEGIFLNRVWRFESFTVTSLQVEIVLSALGLMLALTAFLSRTRMGKAIRAVAESQRTARLLGINVDGVIAFTFFVSSALGGVAGILYGLYFDALAPDMGRSIELKGLAVIILGGMGSIPGAILGGIAFGLSEVFTVALTGTSNLRDAVAFSVLFVILILKPSGLLGRGRVREA
ncbi:MAG: branched-chain amino acid ABC transporter permease [Syntrophobacteraceae bacterium]